MKSLLKISCCFIMSLFCSQLQAQVIAPYLKIIRYNSNVDYNNSSVSVLRNVVLNDTLSGATSTNTPLEIQNLRDAVVDGYYLSNGGQQYFSFDTDTVINGIAVSKNDVIHCPNFACSTFDFFFDSIIHNIGNVNINAFTIDPSNNQLLFSIESDGLINGSAYLASDIIRYNGSGFTLEYDSTANIFSRYKNIDGLSYLPEINKFLVSFNDESIFHEIYELDISTNNWQTAYTPLSLGDSCPFINLKSLNITISQFIFKDSFE